MKILRHFPHSLKLDIYIKQGTHSTEDEINKQINDRERVAAVSLSDTIILIVE